MMHLITARLCPCVSQPSRGA